MKGLFIKDFAYLKQNKFLYLFLIIFGLGFSLLYDNSSFILGYFSVFPGILVLGTMNYDDYNHGLSFIFTLPSTKRDYVKEKYYLSYIISIFLLFVACILSMISDFRMLHDFSFVNIDWLLGIISTLMFSFLLISLLIPIQIKFGSQKSQLAMIIVFGGIALLGIVLYCLSEITGIHLEYYLDQLFSISPYIIVSIFICIVAIMNFISYKISFSLLEKKEY